VLFPASPARRGLAIGSRPTASSPVGGLEGGGSGSLERQAPAPKQASPLRHQRRAMPLTPAHRNAANSEPIPHASGNHPTSPKRSRLAWLADRGKRSCGLRVTTLGGFLLLVRSDEPRDAMSVTLDDSWTKLARGKEHLAALSQGCGEYLDTGPEITVEMYNDPDTGSVETRFIGEPSPPARIGAIVGDIVHNLRSALDVAAWQLAIANDEAAARNGRNQASFPLTRCAEEFKKPHRALKFFSEPARAVIERLKPYQPSMEALGWLRDLSNADKHRVATFSFTGLDVEPVPEVGVRKFSALHLRFGTDEGHLGLIGTQAIFVTVEAALQEIESGVADSRN
jgi:hypothetical protein